MKQIEKTYSRKAGKDYMAGYDGYSMSNNAVAAYENGEKPLSKWSKEDIIDAIATAIRDDELTLNCSFEALKKAPVKVLKTLCLSYSSWHHTSSHYNRTDFYSLDIHKIAQLSDVIIEDRIIASAEQSPEEKEEAWECAFLEWGGTRKHPKATEVVEKGVIKGDWFYRADGTKKKTTANGFRCIRRL